MIPHDYYALLSHADPLSGPYYIFIENLPDSTGWQNIKDFIKSQFGRKFEIYVRIFNPHKDHGWVRVLGYSTFKQVTNILRKTPFRGRDIRTTNPGYNNDGSGSVLIRAPLETDKQYTVRQNPSLPAPTQLSISQHSEPSPHTDFQHHLNPPPSPMGPPMPYQVFNDGSVVSHITVYHPVPFQYYSQTIFPSYMHPPVPAPEQYYPLREYMSQPPPPPTPSQLYFRNPPPQTGQCDVPEQHLHHPEHTQLPALLPAPQLKLATDLEEEQRQILVNLSGPASSSAAADKREAIIRAALTTPSLLERVDGFPDYIVATFISITAAKEALADLSPLGSILVRSGDPPGRCEDDKSTKNSDSDPTTFVPSITSSPPPTPSFPTQNKSQKTRHEYGQSNSVVVVVNGTITPPHSPSPTGAVSGSTFPSLDSLAASLPVAALRDPRILVVNGSAST